MQTREKKNAYQRAYRAIPKNREKMRRWAREAARSMSPAQRARKNEMQRKWWAARPGLKAKKDAEYYAAHKDKFREYARRPRVAKRRRDRTRERYQSVESYRTRVLQLAHESYMRRRRYVISYVREYMKRHPLKARAWSNARSAELRDSYIVNQLSRRGGPPAGMIPPSLIAAMRANLELKRLTRKRKGANGND